MRVLIVDDDSSIRHVVRTALDGMQVVEAADGWSALDLLGRETLDLVLLDMMMPEMSGLEVLARIRADEVLTLLPVVMLSARAAERDHLSAFRYGADGYITKPFDLDELLQTVTGVAARSAPERTAVRQRELERAELLERIEIRFGG